MKKILFATTALVATAGAASAEIALTGSAEIGILGGDVYATTQFHTDIDVTFTMTGEADNGLTFGANIDLDESDGAGRSAACFITDNDDIDGPLTINGEVVDLENVVGGVVGGGAFADGDNVNAECFIAAVRGDSLAFDNTKQGGEAIFVAYGGARLDMGDVDGAFDAAMQEVNVAGGSIADDETTHAGFNGNAGLDGGYDGQIATFSYTASGFTGYLSAEVDDSGVGNPIWGLGVKYVANLSGADLTFGLGYQTVDLGAGNDMSITGASIKADMSNGISAAVNYSELTLNSTKLADHWALGLGYTMNALAIGVNYGEYDFGGGFQDSGFGLAASYDLGGGLSARFGYGSSSVDILPNTSVDFDSYSLGLAMSF